VIENPSSIPLPQTLHFAKLAVEIKKDLFLEITKSWISLDFVDAKI